MDGGTHCAAASDEIHISLVRLDTVTLGGARELTVVHATLEASGIVP